MKEKKYNFRFDRCASILACVIIFVTVCSLASGQVVLVPNKLRPSRGAGKAKSRPKSAPAATPTPTAEPLPTPEAAPVLLSFAVVPPPLKNDVTSDVTESTRKLVTRPELLGYEFDVIKTDERGHARERDRRKERARFYLEGLGGVANLEMVEIPAGMFLMGSDDAQLERAGGNYSRGLTKETKSELLSRLRSEAPQRMVTVASFFLSKYEVTQAQWRAVAGLPKVNRELMSDPSHFKGGNLPVEQISWEDAMEFCERLSRATGRRYRLPTEAEWEYASRAGTSWPFSFGETVSPEFVNYNGRLPYGRASRSTYRQQTVNAGGLGVANAFGLYDMHGNVWEWCLDSWHENYAGAPSDGTAREKDGAPESRVLRGGAWDSSAAECRSSGRRQAPRTSRSNNMGFRVTAEAVVAPAGK